VKTVRDLLVEFKEKPRPGDEPPVLTLTERNGFVRQAERFKKRLATEDVSNYKVVRRLDIAFNPYLLWAGAVAQNTIVDEGIISPLYPTFRVREGHDPRFVARLLLTPQLIGAYDGIAFGSVPRRRRSSVEDFLNLPLAHIPPLTEQHRISAILDHADALRAKRRQVLAHLDSLTQAIFTEMFSAGDFDPMRAGVVMPNMRNGLSPATSGTHEAQVLTLSSVTQGLFNPSAVKPGVFAMEPPADKRITNRDFLMCRGNGNKALVGVGTYARENRPDLVFPDTVIAGTVDTTLVTMPFLEAAWRRRDVRAQIESVARTTNGTYKVNQQTLSGVLVRVPPLDLQEAFAARIAHVAHQHAAVQRATTADSELFASLQARAFRGEL
jgi:type I restriction enzyme S subunit